MTEPGCRFGFATESLAHFRIARQMRIQHLDDHTATEHRVRRFIHVCHAAAGDATHDGEASAGRASQCGDLRVRHIDRRRRDVGQRMAAAHAVRCRRAIPGAAIRAEHADPGES